MRGFTRSGPLPSGAATVAEHHVAVGSLVLAGAIAPAEDVDEHALRWHVFVWDLWFLLRGTGQGCARAGSLIEDAPHGRVAESVATGWKQPPSLAFGAPAPTMSRRAVTVLPFDATSTGAADAGVG